MNNMATCKKEPFVPTEEQTEALREAYRLARRNKQSLKSSFYWKVPLIGVVLFLKRGDTVIVKSVPCDAIAKWQRVQLRRES